MFKRFQASVKQNVTNLVASKWYYWFLALISFVFVMLFSRATSPLYAYVGYDVACFKQMGRAIVEGYTPYLDYFDNKGALFYFLYAVFALFGRFDGIAIVIFQIINISITLVLLDRIISLFKNGYGRVIVLLICWLLIVCFSVCGGLTEEWSMVFVCYPIYEFLKAYKNGSEIKARVFFYIGLCLGVLTYIRINNAAPFCGFVVCYFINLIIHKEWSDLLKKVLSFLGGIAIVTVLVFLYFYIKAGNEGVDWFLYGNFVCGFEYLMYDFHDPLYQKIVYFLMFGTFFIVQIISSSKEKALLLPLTLSYILFLIGFGTRCLEHYQMVMIPLYGITLSTIRIKSKIIMIAVYICLIISALCYLIRPLGFLYNEVVKGNDKFEVAYAGFHEIYKNIPENERSSIYSYNTNLVCCGLLCNERVLECNKVLCNMLNFTLTRFDELAALLEKTKPTWIMINAKAKIYESDYSFIVNNYEVKYHFNYDTSYIGEKGITTDFYLIRIKNN